MEDEEEEGEEEEEEDSLHTVYLQLYPELIAYPCLFWVRSILTPSWTVKSEKYVIWYSLVLSMVLKNGYPKKTIDL